MASETFGSFPHLSGESLTCKDSSAEQGFNSLHAQREACEAFIKSQAGEGWSMVKTAYQRWWTVGCDHGAAFSNRPAATSSTMDVDGISRFSRVECPCMPGLSDCAESCECMR